MFPFHFNILIFPPNKPHGPCFCFCPSVASQCQEVDLHICHHLLLPTYPSSALENYQNIAHVSVLEEKQSVSHRLIA